jgi:hypothetical protein
MARKEDCWLFTGENRGSEWLLGRRIAGRRLVKKGNPNGGSEEGSLAVDR